MSLVVVSIFILYCIYSGIIFVFFPKRYKGIRFSTKNITYIAMLTAASVTITVVISKLVPFTVLPPVRISFEGLMVKIAGFIFGPIVGFLSGIITDLICILFIPTYFHIAYLITIASYGFVCGLVSVFNDAVKKRKWIIFVVSNILIATFSFFLIYNMATFSGHLIPIYHNLKVPKLLAISIISSVCGAIFLIQFLAYILCFLHKRKEKNTFFSKIYYIYASQKFLPKNFNDNMLAIIFLAIVTELFVTALIVPWGDLSLFKIHSEQKASGFMAILIYRCIEAPFKIIFNSALIYSAYTVMKPLINKDK